MDEETPVSEAMETRCVQCNSVLHEGQDRQATDGGVFCRPCFEQLQEHVRRSLEAQGENINYPMAFTGAVLGGLVGAVAWWGFTVVTNIAFGLVAVVIGFTVGKGATILSGNKRAVGLQALAVVVAGLSYLYASYLVNRTFVLRALAEQGEELVLPLLPAPGLLVEVVGLSFDVMDVVFIAIVLWQAWKIPAPIRLAAA